MDGRPIRMDDGIVRSFGRLVLHRRGLLRMDDKTLLSDDRTVLHDDRAILMNDRIVRSSGRLVLHRRRIVRMNGKTILSNHRTLLMNDGTLLRNDRTILHRRKPRKTTPPSAESFVLAQNDLGRAGFSSGRDSTTKRGKPDSQENLVPGAVRVQSLPTARITTSTVVCNCLQYRHSVLRLGLCLPLSMLLIVCAVSLPGRAKA